jgi:hypothetical protein
MGDELPEAEVSVDGEGEVELNGVGEGVAVGLLQGYPGDVVYYVHFVVDAEEGGFYQLVVVVEVALRFGLFGFDLH